MPESWPVVRDWSGYQAQPRDFRYAQVERPDAEQMLARLRPLGFSSLAQWNACLRQLWQAVHGSGLSDATIQLRGSSTTFFSGNHSKVFPQSEDECAEFAELAKRPAVQARHAGGLRHSRTRRSCLAAASGTASIASGWPGNGATTISRSSGPAFGSW